MSVDTFPPPVSVLVAALRRAVSLSHCTCPLPTSIRRPLTDEISVVRRSQAAEAAQGSCLRDGMTTDGFLGALWPPVCLRECCCRALPPCVGACAAGSFARRACAMRAKEHGFCVGGVPPSSPPSGVVMGPPPWRLRRCVALTGSRTRAHSASSLCAADCSRPLAPRSQTLVRALWRPPRPPACAPACVASVPLPSLPPPLVCAPVGIVEGPVGPGMLTLCACSVYVRGAPLTPGNSVAVLSGSGSVRGRYRDVQGPGRVVGSGMTCTRGAPKLPYLSPSRINPPPPPRVR